MVYEHGQLSITQKQGIIKVIPKKKRKDKSFLENWRPLSLLNVDYKIATKVIAHRISSVLPIIVKEDQIGYVKGRYIGQNIRLITDIMKVTKLESIPGLAIFIDFKKHSTRWIGTSSSGRCKLLRGCLCKNRPLILLRKFDFSHKLVFRSPYLFNH